MKTQISALIDDELDGAEADRVIDAILKDPEYREYWQACQLASDNLRGETTPVSAGFHEGVMARLALEPTVLSPVSIPAKKASLPSHKLAYSLAAAVAGVAVVGWMGLSAEAPRDLPIISAFVAPAPTASVQTVSFRPTTGKLKEHLIAHQSSAHGVGLQSVSPYIRTVSDVQQVSSR